MSLAIWSSHQVFQRVDSAFRALLSTPKSQSAFNRHPSMCAADRPLRVVHIAEDQRPPLHTAGAWSFQAAWLMCVLSSTA